MAATFLPLLSLTARDDDELKLALERVGPVLVSPQELANDDENELREYYVLAEHTTQPDQVLEWLNDGALKVIVPSSLLSRLAQSSIPSARLVLLLDIISQGGVATVPDKLRSAVSGVLVKSPTVDTTVISSLKGFFPGADLYVLPQEAGNSLQAIRDLKTIGAKLVIPSEHLTLNESTSTATNIGDAFLATVSSDRPDGLFPTIVTSYANSRNLGLVYSSPESVKESIKTGKGVYQSRKHGLWRKGETSGATQEVICIRTDCDQDALEFVVAQAGTGFCHLNQPSCFGDLSGLAKLERTLISRLQDAPPKSYTHRLFNDSDLLQKKIREEADELCAAEKREDIAFEAADLLYFAMVKCIGNGVSLADVEACLDAKAKKITRRAGDAKPQYSSVPPPNTTTNPTTSSLTNGVPKPTTNGVNGTSAINRVNGVNGMNGHLPKTATTNGHDDDRIRMRPVNITGISKQERAALLQRPVTKSDDMIGRVRPIVNRVRQEGDSALRDLTAKFDKATISDVLIHPPYFDAASSACLDGETRIPLDPEVKKAIDRAYGNISTFHEAQIPRTLEVQTMPGVTCRRFAKSISRVGLYVPGGTAILPSTALMLGIPAQVAGCKEVVLATPPRPDGTVSPEVLYVASLVGATAILKSGGAQAVAAMAYGTETVPKVDKIFGPGNQWVTAAKMLVSIDSDAMVAIDMPAGPSEVLVIADESSNPTFVAADLLSQAEHGVDSQVVLIGINLTPDQLSAIEDEVDRQARLLPRVDIVRESIGKSLVVSAGSLEEAMAFSNDYAPEHLIVNLKETEGVLEMVENAGSVFIGQYTPESCGDYASGTNHTLPTNGFARQYSGVNTQSFQKHITSQEITPEGLKALGPVVVTLADCEGLTAHGNAVRVRLSALAA